MAENFADEPIGTMVTASHTVKYVNGRIDEQPRPYKMISYCIIFLVTQ